MASGFIPVFIDTLKDEDSTSRFHENPGSYPVLRVHDLEGHDIAGRLDGDDVDGNLPLEAVKQQLRDGLKAFAQ